MSNRVVFQPCVFIDILGDAREELYGYRVFDDYDAQYDTNMTREALDALTSSAAWAIMQENYPDLADAARDRGGFLYGGEWIDLTTINVCDNVVDNEGE